MSEQSLVKRVTRKGRAYKGLMREGRVWARIAPALRPHVRRYLSKNPGQLNELINLALAQHFENEWTRATPTVGTSGPMGEG